MNWSDDPPTKPGKYWWRRSWQWEPIQREVELDGKLYSHRYCQLVPASHVGGQWGDKVEGA